MSPEARLQKLNLTLPTTPKPLGAYVPAVEAGGEEAADDEEQVDERRQPLVGRELPEQERHEHADRAVRVHSTSVRGFASLPVSFTRRLDTPRESTTSRATRRPKEG